MLQTKEEVVKLLIRPNAFRSWLSEKDPKAIIGTSRDTTSCPIARFLRHSGVEAEVHSQRISVANPRNIFFFSYVLHKEDIADWVKQFIYNLDAQEPRETTASAALEILNVLQDIG